MNTRQPIIGDDDEHRVVRFVPRSSATPPHRPAADPGLAGGDLRPPGEALDEPDDFRHRMLANAAALAVTALLVGAGIWLAVTIADLRKTQDCVLMGRRDCARIAIPRT